MQRATQIQESKIPRHILAPRAFSTIHPEGNRAPGTLIDPRALLAPAAMAEIAEGRLPDLWQVCLDVYHTFQLRNAPYSAVQFTPVLRQLERLDPVEVETVLLNTQTRHVLVENELLKMVLIHWRPGEISSIHGHPEGGCVFKVLHGSVEELRYTAGESPRLLSVSTYQAGAMAYIDDEMGYHAVGNPFDVSAISIHAYTPGRKQMRK